MNYHLRNQKLEEETWKERKRIANEELLDNRFTDTKRSTKEERKQYRLEKKQREKDDKLRWTVTPYALFSKRVDKISCECEGENIRAGQYCDTCRLLVKVDEYMMDLFRRYAQGSTTAAPATAKK